MLKYVESSWLSQYELMLQGQQDLRWRIQGAFQDAGLIVRRTIDEYTLGTNRFRAIGPHTRLQIEMLSPAGGNQPVLIGFLSIEPYGQHEATLRVPPKRGAGDRPGDEAVFPDSLDGRLFRFVLAQIFRELQLSSYNPELRP